MALLTVVPAAAKSSSARTCRDVVLRTGTGDIYTRTYEIAVWRTGCKRARRIVRAYLRGAEGTDSLPRPRGFRCRSGRAGGVCRKRPSRVWWSYNRHITCRYHDVPFPCARERPCRSVKTFSEGVRVRSRVFARTVSCQRARRIVRGWGRSPGIRDKWTAVGGSGTGAVYYPRRFGELLSWPKVRRRKHLRYSNVVLL